MVLYAGAWVAEGSTDEVSDSARRMADTVVGALPRLGVAVVVVLVGWLFSRAVRWLLHGALRRRRTPSFSVVMSKLGGWLVFGLAVFVAIAVTFPSVQPVDLLAGLGFFSVAAGFAFQDILENTLAGVLILFRQPFRSGDQIEVQDQVGTVEGITIRETRIRRFDGQLVLVPNRDVYKNVIRVQTAGPARRLSFVVGIAYENEPAAACRAIVSALADLDGVLDAPPPEALAAELGPSTVDIDVRFWTASTEHESRHALNAAIVAAKAALDHEGIEMPADIVLLQAAPSFRASMRGYRDVTPGGAVMSEPRTDEPRGPSGRPRVERSGPVLSDHRR